MNCEHDWMRRGLVGDLWRECFLCGVRDDRMALDDCDPGICAKREGHGGECEDLSGFSP